MNALSFSFGASVVSWNYTTYLNVVFLVIAGVVVWRFVRTGGLPMLLMMDKPMRHAAAEHQ